MEKAQWLEEGNAQRQGVVVVVGRYARVGVSPVSGPVGPQSETDCTKPKTGS